MFGLNNTPAIRCIDSSSMNSFQKSLTTVKSSHSTEPTNNSISRFSEEYKSLRANKNVGKARKCCARLTLTANWFLLRRSKISVLSTLLLIHLNSVNVNTEWPFLQYARCSSFFFLFGTSKKRRNSGYLLRHVSEMINKNRGRLYTVIDASKAVRLTWIWTNWDKIHLIRVKYVLIMHENSK